MAKIMLVEDDNNLREIYEARLLAEGYEIVSAKDGEEALALAVKEKPDLIISDVMMPKISGFDMLDILRSTAETKNTKVIMMTALSQAEDKARADKLGADRYLVKSQVTLEDVAKVAHDVLNGEDTPPASITPAAAAEPAPTAAPAPAEPTAAPEPTVITPAEPPAAPAPSPAPEPAPTPAEPTTPAPVPDTTPAPEPATAAPAAEPAAPPVEEPAASPAPATSGISDDLTQTTAAEEAAIESQISEIFAHQTPEEAAEAAKAAEEAAAAEAAKAAEAAPVAESTPVETSGKVIDTIEVAPAPDDNPALAEAPAPVAAPPADDTQVAPAPEPATEPATPPADEEPAKLDPSDPSVPPGKRIIQPINDVVKSPDLNELLKKEESQTPVTPPTATTVLKPIPGQDITPPANPSGAAPGDIAL